MANLMTLVEFTRTLDEEAVIKGAPSIGFSSVSIDSRKINAGGLFFAIKGQRDGHQFVQMASDAGAAAAVVEYPVPVSIPQIIVKDSRRALLDSAKSWRTRFKIPVVAIAGSNGKTTTTQMILSILRVRYDKDSWIGTEGNLNNDLGVALMLWKLRDHHEVAAFEAGMNHIGEMKPLVEAINPTISTVTNTQRDHQEFLASLQETAEENGEVFSHLPMQGVAVINAEDPFFDLWRKQAGNSRIVSFGKEGSDVYATECSDGFMLHTPLGKTQIQLSLPGDHNVKNAVCAAAVNFSMGRDLSDIKKGLESFKGAPHRTQIQRLCDDSLVIDDSYNANPDSMAAAIRLLASYEKPKLLVLGDMGELGVESPQLHRQVGELARQLGIDDFFSIGNRMLDAVEGFGEKAQHFETQKDLLEAIQKKLETGPRVILFKASNFMRLFNVAEALCKSGR